MARTKVNNEETTKDVVDEVKVTETTKEDVKATKTLFLEKDRGQRGNQQLFVSVNGKDYLIQRGVPVEVPILVYNVVMDSLRAKEEAYNFIDNTAKN